MEDLKGVLTSGNKFTEKGARQTPTEENHEAERESKEREWSILIKTMDQLSCFLFLVLKNSPSKFAYIDNFFVETERMIENH